MELAEGGLMIDFLLKFGSYSSEIARAYFLQMISAVNEIHEIGFCHRDLKPENILFDINANLKICDFGVSTYSAGRTGNELLYSLIGTSHYMAPEIHEAKAYNGPVVDLFACGVILFIMVTGRPPFIQPKITDAYYSKFFQDNQAFWKKHNELYKKQFNQEIESDFIDIMNQMLQYDPLQRLTYQQILQYQWVKKPVATAKDIANDFKLKLFKLQGEQNAKRLLNQAKRKNEGKMKVSGQFGKFSEGSQLKELQTSLVYQLEGENSFEVRIPYYAKAPLKFSQFLRSISPEDIIQEIDSWLCKNAANYEIYDQDYKIKASFMEEDQVVSLQFKLYYTENNLFLVDIIKKSGNQIQFQQIVEEILASSEIQDIIDGDNTS